MPSKVAKAHGSPALFDVAQDIAGAAPVQLVEQWIGGAQDQASAERLLEPYKVRGYSVCSDASGLTRLSGQKGLLEILAMLELPKQIVHGHGVAIGGAGVGIWAADNTQMFYPPEISAGTIVSMLLGVQDEIARQCQIKIGIGAHLGSFYSLGGGLYGAEADAIEEIAENDTAGGETVISQAIVDRLPPSHGFTLAKREDLPGILGVITRVLDGPRLADLVPAKDRYPIPYSEAFHADLVAFAPRREDRALGARILDRYAARKVVVLIEREAAIAASAEIALLRDMELSAFMKVAGQRHLASDGGAEIKVAGALGIYVFDDAGAAIAFARAFSRDLRAQGVACRIGVDVGLVLVFDLAGGGKDIAGQPVNIASKMAQDRGEFGHIYLSQAMACLVDVRGFNEVRFEVSGVEILAREQRLSD